MSIFFGGGDYTTDLDEFGGVTSLTWMSLGGCTTDLDEFGGYTTDLDEFVEVLVLAVHPHPLVRDDVAHVEPLRRVYHQHVPDQRLAL